MEEKLQELKNRLREISDFSSAASVLSWDQATYMPPQGAAARGRHLSTLGRIAHEKATDPRLGELLNALQDGVSGLPEDSDDRALVRVAKRNYDRLTKIPSDRVAAFSQHASESFQVWTQARPENDFASTRPYLETNLEFSIEFANYFPGYDHIADPLIDFSDYGMKAESVRAVFKDLQEALVPLVQAISDQKVADDACLKQYFPEDQQIAIGEEVIKNFGFDFRRGRQDKTHHPFMTRFSSGDVRITTRYQERDFSDGFFSTLHEAGHALYELGINPEYDGSPLGNGTSAGVHESQSRLWENFVGRSQNFWEGFYPRLQDYFPAQFGEVDLDTFYRAINKVSRSLIRVDADEVTYNLHVMMRFELELQLLEGSLEVKDLPEAWREAMRASFGIVPEDDKNGVLQDTHWYAGVIGGVFQGYTLGNIMCGQFYDAALRAHPEIPEQVRAGNFETLRTWLQQNVYWYGAKYTAEELLERTTGGGLRTEPFVNYLKKKFGALYSI